MTNWKSNIFLKAIGTICFVVFLINCIVIILAPNHGTEIKWELIRPGFSGKEALYRVVLIINPFVLENAFIITFLFGLIYFIIYYLRIKKQEKEEKIILTGILLVIVFMIIMSWLFVFSYGQFYAEDIYSFPGTLTPVY